MSHFFFETSEGANLWGIFWGFLSGFVFGVFVSPLFRKGDK
jgi:hypothetical protein